MPLQYGAADTMEGGLKGRKTNLILDFRPYNYMALNIITNANKVPLHLTLKS